MTGVLDASMALAWLFKRADPVEAAMAEQTLRDLPSTAWWVPAIWYAEIANALLRGERAGIIPPSQSAFFLDRVFQARIETDHEPQRNLQDKVLDIGRTYRLTAYDAAYLELALRTGKTLATFNRQLAEAARKAGGRVFGDAA